MLAGGVPARRFGRLSERWQKMRLHWPLALVLVAFLGLGLAYSVTMPIFEASDEMHHYRFVEHLRLTGQLPVQIGGVPKNLPRQEASQPPLYYALMAGISWWTLQQPAEITPNPHSTTGVPLALDNKNMVLHTPAETFPYRGPALTVHVLRSASLLLSATSIALAYALALRVTGGSRALAAAVAALSAFIPMFIFISASVNNDNLVTAVSALAVLLMLRMLQGEHDWRQFAMLGAVLGVAALSKLSALGLFGLLGFTCLILAWRERALWRYLGRGLLAGGIAFIIAGWWYLRNLALYGELLGTDAMLRAAGKRPGSYDAWALLSELEGLRINFWGLLGGVNLLLPSYYYRLYDALTLLAVAGLVVLLVRRWRGKADLDAASLALVTLWPLVVGVSLVRWTLMTMASQGRLLFPALGCLSLLLVLGLSSLVPRRWHAGLAWALGFGLFVLAALVPFRVILPAYSPLPAPAEAEAAALNHPMHALYADGAIELIGGQLSTARVAPGRGFELDLYWKCLRPVSENYSVFVHAYDRSGKVVGQVDATPGRGLLQTSLWQPGRLVHDHYLVPVGSQAVAPGLLRVHVGLYRYADRTPLPASDAQGKPLGASLYLASIKASAPSGAPLRLPPASKVDADFGGQIVLLGYDLPSREVAPGQELRLTLHWQAIGEIARDYTVFVQLVGPQGLVAQYDGQPQNGSYPTSFWDKGEIVVDPVAVPVRKDVAPGEYQLIAGLYELASGQRLAVGAADYASLGTLVVR